MDKIIKYFLTFWSKPTTNKYDLNVNILGFPSLITEKVNWYVWHWECYYDDKKFRLESYEEIKKFLRLLQSNRVKTRGDLKQYLRFRRTYATNKYYKFDELRKLHYILKECGWWALDPWWHFHADGGRNIKWENANLILTDHSISLALSRFLIPFNRDWCFCLASDFA